MMLIPSLLIPYDQLLRIYDINNLNDILDFIDNNIDIMLYDSINRILNCWIRFNFLYLKKNNKILCKIYYKIFSKFYTLITSNKIFFDMQTELFLKKWFKKNNKKDFYINLGSNLKNFLSSKYES